MRALAIRLTSYAELPSRRADETWCRFYFSAVGGAPDEAGTERPHTSYRVDVSSNRALKVKTSRLGASNPEPFEVWVRQGTRP